MNEAAAAARRAYQREWRRKNPEKIRAAQERYWTKKAREMNEQKQDAEQDPKQDTEEVKTWQRKQCWKMSGI